MLYFIGLLILALLALVFYDTKGEAWFLQWLGAAYIAGVISATLVSWLIKLV